MMRRPLSVALCAVLAFLASGCVTLSRPLPQKTRYLLEPRRNAEAADTAGTTGAAPANPTAATSADSPQGRIFVDPVHVNPLFDHKGFLYRVGEDAYERDFYHELWASPDVLVRQATIEWLRDSPVLRTGIEDRRPSAARWRLGGRIDRFFADLRDASAPLAVIEVSFDLVDAQAHGRTDPGTDDATLRRRYRVEVPARDASPEALARAWTEALARILGDLESDLARALAR